MSFPEKVELFGRLHRFIIRKGTGCHKTLARRLDISVSALYRHLETLNNMGAEIAYCSHRQSYYYVEDFELKF